MRIQGDGGRSNRDPRPGLPAARGPLSEALVELLREVPLSHAGSQPLPTLPGRDGVLGEDFQLSLYLLYELHYRGFRDVDERWEWEPPLLGLRASLEADFEGTLHELVPGEDAIEPGRVGETIMAL